MRRFLLTTLIVLAGLRAKPALTLKGHPKLGPEAVPMPDKPRISALRRRPITGR